MPVKNILFIFFTASIISCGGPVSTQPDTEPGVLTEAEVMAFINKYDDAWTRKDTVLLKAMMGEDYIYFSSKGSISTKSNTIGMFDPVNNYIVDTSYRNDINIILNGNTAIVSSHWVGNGTFQTGTFNDDQRCGLVIQKIDSVVKIISEHCVQIAE